METNCTIRVFPKASVLGSFLPREASECTNTTCISQPIIDCTVRP